MATGEPVEYYSDYVEYAEYADGMQFYDEASSTLHYDDQVYNVYSSASTIKPLPQKPGEYEATSYQLDSELHYDPESFDYTYENYPHSPDATYTDMYAPPEQSRVYPYNSLRGMPAYHKLLPPVPPISAPPQRPLPPPPGAYPSDLYYDLPTQPPIDPFRCYDVNTQPSAPPLLYNPDEHSNSPNSSTFSHYQHQHTSF
ncbi:hypothetical protein AX774_g5768 [Zancudomyces culisetae]|uniref:Uncharacterized protein n=1 Tax=Zancudomyces culisetae TaxID=1213189 RepID=A0A1R1PIM1_ZANCU|nr:hypothetical protein AX774_g5768 [Zancudomyces culisetae]|eukprot:OMH80788.1 hypothetical protein AX774_g5768 [Zancudomyces culisetae]